jgi:hypothetical protein
VENLSGIDMSGVRVHYNSTKPAEVGALAYTQGANIHVAPGQERHLPHEAWHVVQQVKGRVKPTMQLKDGVPVNDDEELEHEADKMGAFAINQSINAESEYKRRLNHNSLRDNMKVQQISNITVVQLVRDITEAEIEVLNQCIDILDYFRDVLTHSSSIPPRLEVEFFPLFETVVFISSKIYETRKVEGDNDIQDLDHKCKTLMVMMNQAVSLAEGDRKATAPGMFRPPAKSSPHMPDSVKTQAMEAAQKMTTDLAGKALFERALFERNLAILKANKEAVFYVIGKNAMGQGDTAFIVRTVTLLRSMGLQAVGVKKDAEAHDVGTSFSKSILYIRPEIMISKAKEGDFIIEGPLSDPASFDPSKTTIMDTMEGFNVELRTIYNLRLYEYGTLTLRGGQLVRGEGNTAINVVSHVNDPRHAFMGMGHGEIGAFYNSASTKNEETLLNILKTNAPTDHTSRILYPLFESYPELQIFIGYANQHDVVTSWARAVNSIMEKRGSKAIIVGVYGGKNPDVQYKIPDGNWVLVFDRQKEKGQKGIIAQSESSSSNSRVVLTNSLPFEVMNALQQRAQPFTLSTGNYSLSEAIENGHMSTYEMLNFNAGVKTAYVAQVEHALTKLELPPELKRAIMELAKASPENLLRLTQEIEVVLKYPYEVKLVMDVIKANTDIKENLVARLANLVEMRQK